MGFLKKILFIYLERREGREKEREKNMDWLLLTHPQLGTWPATQAYALTGNQTSDPLVCRPALNPLHHTSQGWNFFLFCFSFLNNVLLFMPGWCDSVDWVLTCEPKGHWFDSQSGHMPGLWARSPVGGTREATTHWCFSPSFSFPSPLSENK